jgi:hypothetical protein
MSAPGQSRSRLTYSITSSAVAKRFRDGKAERLGGFQIDHEFEL